MTCKDQSYAHRAYDLKYMTQYNKMNEERQWKKQQAQKAAFAVFIPKISSDNMTV